MFKLGMKWAIVFLSLMVLPAFTGCDQIKSFFTDKKPVSTTAPSSSSSSSSAVDPNAPLPPNVLVRVGNWTLTADEFKERVTALKQVLPEFDANDLESKKLVLDELIRQRLLVMEAQKEGIADKKEINDAVEEFRNSLLVREIALNLTKGIAVSNEEAQTFYDQNKDKLKEPIEYHIREIMVNDPEEAKNILAELLKGADFAQTAKSKSKSPSAAQGGDIGFINMLNLPELEKIIGTLDIGEVSTAFQGPDGQYIVKLEEKREGKLPEFPSIKQDILAYLTQLKQQQIIVDHIEKLKQNTPVKTNTELLK